MASSKTQYHRFQWSESQPGVWERDIDECCASFTISPRDSAITNEEEIRLEDALRKAWITLHYHHPTLRSHIQHDEDTGRWKRVYSKSEEEDEKHWLTLTFKTVDVKGAPLQWFNDEAPSIKFPTLFYVRPIERNEYRKSVFLRCPHDITGGVGILQLINQLFDHAARAYEQGTQYAPPPTGNEHTRLSPCLRLAADIVEPLPETQTKRFEEIQIQNGTIYNHPGLLSLPSSSKGRASKDGKRQRLSVSIPKVTTEEILSKSKAIAPGVSVTHIFTSSLALALSKLQPRREESYPVRYANQSMINLRPHCRSPYNTGEHAAAAYHTVSAQALGIDLVVPASTDAKGDEVNELPEIAIIVRDFYKAVRPVSPSDEQIMFAPMVFKSLTPPPGSDPHAVSEPPFCPVPLSSIGNVTSIVSPSHGDFELTNVWAASEPIGAGVALFLATWDGQIELSGVFDTRYHDPEYIEDFLKRIANCVLMGLGIDNRAGLS